jgi:hypothetical protein
MPGSCAAILHSPRIAVGVEEEAEQALTASYFDLFGVGGWEKIERGRDLGAMESFGVTYSNRF